MSGNYIYKTKSKTRTFKKGKYYHEFADFIYQNLSLNGDMKSNEKYIVTVTKIEGKK